MIKFDQVVYAVKRLENSYILVDSFSEEIAFYGLVHSNNWYIYMLALKYFWW